MFNFALISSMFLLGCRQYPDVIFLTVDTLRVDHVEAFSLGSPSKTPNINSLAKDSVLFTQAYSPISVTGPAFSTLHTGMEPSEHGVIINMFRGGVPLSDSKTTLAEILLGQGYQTSAFVSGFTLNPTLNLQQGFENYDFPTDLGANRRRRSGSQTTEAMLDWLQFTMGNVFVWWHTYDPHGPWDVWATEEELVQIEKSKTKNQVEEDNNRRKRQQEKRKKKKKWYQKKERKLDIKKVPSENPALSSKERSNLKHIPKYQQLGTLTDIDLYKDLYRRSVEHTDSEIGKIITFLKKKNRYDNSIIILTADHGESFTERELWFDHGTYPHEEQLHVPLLIKLPKQERAGEKYTQLVGLRDIMPSILVFLGFSIPQDVSGKNILVKDEGWQKLWGESSHCKKEIVLPCFPIGPKGKILSVRTEKHRIIRNILNESISFQVYDIIEDPKELSPIEIQPKHQSMIEDVAEMYGQRKEQIDSISWPDAQKYKKNKTSNSTHPEKQEEQKAQQNAEELDMLRQLGYME
jgi:arylsulfatase A-like enzyme